MASFSATIAMFQPLSKSSFGNVSQRSGRLSNIGTLGWSKSRFPNLTMARRFINCAAKPETIDKVCEIVRKQLALAPETEVTADTTFAKLGADSLDTVEIVMTLEQEFGITVEEESSQSITNIQEAAEVIEALMAQGTEKAEPPKST